MDPRCETSIDHFTGNEIVRNKLLVIFTDFVSDFHLFMATRLFQILKKCIGIRSIRVTLEWWQFLSRIDETAATAEMVEELRLELEQCWRPCVVTNVLDRYSEGTGGPDVKLDSNYELTLEQTGSVVVIKNGPGLYVSRTREVMNMRLYSALELAFQPLRFRGGNLTGGNAGVMKEADRAEVS